MRRQQPSLLCCRVPSCQVTGAPKLRGGGDGGRRLERACAAREMCGTRDARRAYKRLRLAPCGDMEVGAAQVVLRRCRASATNKGSREGGGSWPLYTDHGVTLGLCRQRACACAMCARDAKTESTLLRFVCVERTLIRSLTLYSTLIRMYRNKSAQFSI